MLQLNFQNVKTNVEKIGFVETEIGYTRKNYDGQRVIEEITTQKCFRRVTLLSEYIKNLTPKGLDITNITPITDPKIRPDFLACDLDQNQENQKRYKLSRIKGLGGGQFFFKGHEDENDPANQNTHLLKSKMVSTCDLNFRSQATENKNPYVSRDKGWGSISCMGSPDCKLTPTKISMETALPKLSNFDVFETMKSVQSEKSSLLIGFDAEWVGEPREIISWQFSLVVQNMLYEYIFLATGDELLSLDTALAKILDDINYTSFESSKYVYHEACVGFNGAGQQIWKRYNDKDAMVADSHNVHPLFKNDAGKWEAVKYTIDEGHDNGSINKYAPPQFRKWKWSRLRHEFPSKHNVTLVCHAGKVDISTLKTTNDYDFYLRYLSEIQGGAISLNPVSRTVKSRKKGYAGNSYLYPLTLNFRDTMAQAPAGKKSLADLGDAVKIPKLADDSIDKEHMDAFLNADPCLYFEYASRDATVTMLYASALYGYNKEMPVTLTSATAKVVRTFMKDYLDVKSNEDFDREYRGVQRVKKGLVKDLVNPGFLVASNKEPVNERVRDILMYSSQAYHGGLNASMEIGWFKGLTNDFDLQNAYPTAMCLVPDIDWDNPVKVELSHTKLSLDTFLDEKGEYNPMTPLFARVSYTFPNNILHPCLPVNIEGRLISALTSKGLDRVYACGPELYLALKLGAEIEVERGWVLNIRMKDGKPSHSLAHAVKMLVEDRRKAKNLHGKKSLEELILKTMVNSIYGKNAQNVVDKTTWDAYSQEMTQLGDSAITNPVSACLTTSYVRALLYATMNAANTKGYRVYSVTTDGFIADIPTVEELEAFDLYGFVGLTRESRNYLTNNTDDSIWEIKHHQHQLLNLTTRGNMAPVVTGVCAHNSTKSPYPSGSVEDRAWFIEACLSRDDRVAYSDDVWTTFKELSQGSLFKVVPVSRKVSMDFDLKRKPDKASMETVQVDFNGNTYEIANFRTVPYTDVNEAVLYQQKKELCSALRTEKHWDIFFTKILTNATGTRVFEKTGLEWTKLTSCVRGFREGLWTIDQLASTDMTVAEKMDWLNSFKLTDKPFKASDWKNAGKKGRRRNTLPKAEIQDFLDILGAHSYTI